MARAPITVDVSGVKVTLIHPELVGNEIRLKYPAMGEKADYDGSREAAIRLKCLDCCGSDTEVGRCRVYTCGLWTVRPYQDPENSRPFYHIPTQAEYAALRASKYAGKDTGAGAKALAAWREGKKSKEGPGEEG